MGDVSRSSITLSSASYASSLFPAIDDTSSSLIEAILARVSPAESEWKPFLQAYDEVFNERGLDKQSDTVIYDLILKLGLQAGKNWLAKWENVKRAQRELLIQREAAQRVDQGAARGDTIRTPINKADKRARDTVAPYSSHKLRDYPDDDDQPRLTQEALAKLQHAASPYKPIQTPHAGQHGPITRDGTTPRVHFANDTHSHHARVHSDVFRTPELAILPSHTAAEREAMLQQAIQFDRINLLGRMYDDWISRFFVLQRLDMHTVLAREALLKRRSLTFWRERVKRHQEIEGRVELAYDATLQRSCLRLWQQKREKKLQTEWERQMSQGYRTVVRKKDRQLKIAAFQAWREASLDSRALRFRQNCLLRNSLEKWLQNAARLAELDTEANNLQATRDETLLFVAFAKWKTNTILLVREAEITDRRESQVLSSVFTTWRVQLHHSRLANDFGHQSTQKRILSIWRARLAHNETLKQQALSLSRARDEDTMERAFHTWRIREHARLLERAKSMRLARGAMQRWLDRYAAVTTDLDAKATQLVRIWDEDSARRCLSKWLNKAHKHRKALRLASSLNQRLLIQRAFTDWRALLTQRRLAYRKSEVASDFFLQRHMLKTWYKRMRWTQANRTLADKEASVVKTYFQFWHQKTRRNQHFAILEEGITAAIDQRIASDALSKWTNRVIELRERAIKATQEREAYLVHSAFSHWLDKARQNTENLSLVDSFIEVQEEELIRSKFRKWQTSARRKAHLRDLLQKKMQDDERGLVAGIFDRWVDVYKERQLLDQEMDIVRYRAYQQLGAALQTWKARTMTLPAIRFDAQRQRRRFFSIWRERLPERIAENEAIEHDRLRLLEVTLAIWQEGARARVARRAANRFRAFAARSPLPPSSSSSSTLLTVPGRTPVRSRGDNYRTLQKNGPAPVPETLPVVHSPVARRREQTASPSPISIRRPIPSSTLMPELYSASRLRREAGTSPGKRQSSTTSSTPAPPYLGRREDIHNARPVTTARRRGSSTLVEPEHIALPPSSSATGPSSTSSSPLAHQSVLPSTSSNAAVVVSEEADAATQPAPLANRHDRKKSRSRDTFEEGILREMRERLAAAGFGDVGRSRADIRLDEAAAAVTDVSKKEDKTRSRSGSSAVVGSSRNRSRSRSRS